MSEQADCKTERRVQPGDVVHIMLVNNSFYFAVRNPSKVTPVFQRVFLEAGKIFKLGNINELFMGEHNVSNSSQVELTERNTLKIVGNSQSEEEIPLSSLEKHKVRLYLERS